MTTPPPPTPPTGPDDDRDPRVAAWLAVEPLEAATRSRMVAAALAGAGPDTRDAGTDEIHDAVVTPLSTGGRRRSPSAALVSVAAAVLALLVVAGALLLPGSDDDSSPTAARAPAATAPEASRATGDSNALAPGSPSADATAEAPASGALPVLALPSIGDLGDVSTEASLARAARAALSVPPGTATTLTGCAVSAGRAFGSPVAVGTGRIDGRTATVVVSEQAAGTTAVVAVRGRTCGRAVSAILP